MSAILYHNGKVITENEIFAGSVLVEDGIITKIFRGYEQDGGRLPVLPETKTRQGTVPRLVEADGNYISPGFIDTHVHGAMGHDVMDATPDGLLAIAKAHRAHGCTSFLPTTLTSEGSRIKEAVRNVYDVMQNHQNTNEYARILGVHLEGPCFSMKFKGAQNPKYLANPSVTLFNELDSYGITKRISMAPELPGAFETARHFSEKGINISIAHSDADFACVKAAVSHGFSHITHMYNGMSYVNSPDYYCKTGVVEAGLLLDALTCEVIADGKHMPVEILQLLYKCKGPDGLLLTTDSTRPTLMPEGNYELGGLDVLVTDGVAMLADRTSFAGSVATCDRLVRFAYKECGFPLHEAVKMASLNHARIIGMDSEIGSIEVGKRGDIIVFDEDINQKTA